MCECVQFSLFPPSTKWWPLCNASPHSNWLPNNTHTHPHIKYVCVCVCVNHEYGSFNVQWYINTWVCVCVTAKLLIVFSFVFCFACMCDDFFFLVKSADVFASLLCVYLPWRVICIAINGFHTQQFGFFRNQENK